MQELIQRKAALPRLFSLVLFAAVALAPLAASRAGTSKIILDDLTFALGSTTYRIPHFELEGASLSAVDLAGLFKGDEKAVDGKLARFSAKSLRIPALTSETNAGGLVERSAYRDIEAADIVAGKVAVLRAAGAEQTVEKPAGGSLRYLWGPSLAKGMDLRQLAHLALATGLDPQEAAKPLVDEESVESLRIEDKAERVTTTIGRFVIKGVKGRPLPFPAAQLRDRLEKFDPDKPEADPALLKDLIDAVASFDVGSIDVLDLAATGKGAPADSPYTIGVGRIAAGGVANATVGDFALEDMSLVASDGGRLTLKRFGLRDARLYSLVDKPVPWVGHIEAKGLEGDLPDARMSETSRMKFSLAGVEADFADFREIAPTKLSARMDRLAVDLEARGEAPSTAQFLALGYRDLDLSASLAGEWREKTQEAVFAPLRIEGKNIGAVSLNATFGDVSSAAFSPLSIVSKAALLASSLKSVELTLDGGGLVERTLALEAKTARKPIEKLRADYARTAAQAVAAILGGGEKAKKIADAVAAYVIKPKRLHVRLFSEKGVNALDAVVKKPGEILENVQVEAAAER
jgi:hypothetical protein